MNVMSIFAEAQLFSEWVPMTHDSDIVHEVSHLRKLARFEHKLWWPLANRETHVQACGVVLKDEKAGALTMSTVTDDSWFGYSIKQKAGNVVYDIHRAFLFIQLISPTECRIKSILSADPKIPLMPTRVVEWFMKRVVGFYLTFV